jgi:hypothetical protein
MKPFAPSYVRHATRPPLRQGLFLYDSVALAVRAEPRRNGVGSLMTISMSSMGGKTSLKVRFRNATGSRRTKPKRMSRPGLIQSWPA